MLACEIKPFVAESGCKRAIPHPEYFNIHISKDRTPSVIYKHICGILAGL